MLLVRKRILDLQQRRKCPNNQKPNSLILFTSTLILQYNLSQKIKHMQMYLIFQHHLSILNIFKYNICQYIHTYTRIYMNFTQTKKMFY